MFITYLFIYFVLCFLKSPVVLCVRVLCVILELLYIHLFNTQSKYTKNQHAC